MSRSRFFPLLPLVILLAAGCHRGAKPDIKAEKASQPPIPVVTQVAEKETMARTLLVNGQIIPRSQISVLPKTSGRILQLKVAEGDRVSRGQVIATLETPELDWQLRQQKTAQLTAEANLDQAKDSLRRMTELAQEGAVSQQQLVAAKTQVRIADAQVKQAKAAIALMQTQVSNGTVTSPIDGVVIAKGLDVGGMAVPSAPIVTLAEAGALQVKLPLAERDLGLVREGGKVTVTSVALPDEHFDGRVSEIAPMVDPQTRLITVKVDLARAGRLKVGMNVTAEIAGPSHDALVVPAAAVVTDGAEQIVYLAQGSKAARVAVTTGLRDPRRVEITQGLKAGDPVIVKGNSFVKDGDPIRVEGGAL